MPSGATVTVPAGAVSASTPITVGTSTIVAPAGAVSSVYQFGPPGTIFTTPVTVSFPVPAGTKAADVAVYWTKPGSTTEWDVLPATVSGTTASASVTHFSAGFVGAACAIGAACTPANACHTGRTTCNGTPACADTGTPVEDGTTCGTGLTCSSGACTGPACTAGQACTPTGTADPCKTYATACGTDGSTTCGVSGNLPDGTTCGSGLTCSAGTCGSVAPPPNYVPVAVARSYRFQSSAGAGWLTQSDVAVQDTSPTWTRKVVTSSATTYQVRSFLRSAGAVSLSAIVNHLTDGTVQSSSTYSPPQLVLPADTTPGATASSTSTGTSGTTTFTISRALTVNGTESVTVPAGTFSTLKVTTVITQSNAAGNTVVTWWAADVGIVKQLVTTNGLGTSTLELTAYSPMDCTGGPCACNALVNAAPLVTPVFVASGVPTATGGTIVDGTYFLTANRVYTGVGGTSGPTDQQVRNTYSFQSGVMNFVGWHTGLAAEVRRTAVVTFGSQVTAIDTCGSLGDSGTGTMSYSASANQIQFITTNSCPGSLCDPGADAVLTRQ